MSTDTSKILLSIYSVDTILKSDNKLNQTLNAAPTRSKYLLENISEFQKLHKTTSLSLEKLISIRENALTYCINYGLVSKRTKRNRSSLCALIGDLMFEFHPLSEINKNANLKPFRLDPEAKPITDYSNGLISLKDAIATLQDIPKQDEISPNDPTGKSTPKNIIKGFDLTCLINKSHLDRKVFDTINKGLWGMDFTQRDLKTSKYRTK